MRGGFRLAPRVFGCGGILVLLGLVSGCQPASPLGRAGVAIVPPSSWRPVARTTWPVPGTPLAAWAGPEGSSLVVYQGLPIPGGNARALTEALANRLTNLPDLKVVARRTGTLGGIEAGRVEAVGSGTGDALAASGIGVPIAPKGRALLPTRRVVLGFPRQIDTIFLTWHAPEAANDLIQEQIRATLQGLRIDAVKARASSY